jgi:hypothetical protein
VPALRARTARSSPPFSLCPRSEARIAPLVSPFSHALCSFAHRPTGSSLRIAPALAASMDFMKPKLKEGRFKPHHLSEMHAQHPCDLRDLELADNRHNPEVLLLNTSSSTASTTQRSGSSSSTGSRPTRTRRSSSSSIWATRRTSAPRGLHSGRR